ncbi:hypothetical protein ACI8AC_12710 [Geodermatophilus sp. SYSU D00758]
MPVEVFDRVAQLERELAEARAKLDHQRERKRANDKAWRQRHADEVKERTKQRVAAHRARKRQQGT